MASFQSSVSFAATLPQHGSLLDLLETVKSDLWTARAIWIASLMLVAYDQALTLDREVAYLRTGAFRWNKALFMVNRYWPKSDPPSFDNIAFGDGLSSKFCDFYGNWATYTTAPVHLSIGIILIQRVYAMYGCNKTLLIVLLALLAAQVISETIVLGLLVAKAQVIAIPLVSAGCILTDVSTTHMWAYGVPPLVFESVLFVLATFKAFEVARYDTHTPRPLIVLLRDSIVYFGGVFAIFLANVIIMTVARQSLLTVTVGPALAAPSILGCRMLLNIHEALQPTYGGHASIFATSFAPSEPFVAVKPARTSSQVGGSSAATLTAGEESTVNGEDV